ncbi:Photosystem I chain B-like [Amphidinium carterae]
MVAAKLAAAFALIPVADAFLAPSLRATAVQEVKPVVTEAQPSQWGVGSNGVAAVAACAVAAGVVARGVRPVRRTAAKSVTAMQAEDEVKMSAAVPYLTYPERLEGWVGGEKGFDPLRTSDIIDVYWLREAELKHGRICMLATLGWISVDVGARFPAEMFQGVGAIEAHNKMVEAGVMQQMLSIVGVCELFSLYLIKEGLLGRIQRKAGDYFIGKNFLPKEPEKATDMQLKELENGRLAMLAFSGIVTQANLFPESHFPYF